MREIQLPWKCQGRGDCCRRPKVVVMTKEEQAELLEAAPDVNVLWYPDEDGKAVMAANPCPFVTDTNHCSVYEHRPYNCRRFQCYRPAGEVYHEDAYGNCLNLLERLKDSRQIRRDYQIKQRKAQRWARTHGWEDTP